ncbi:RecB family exonuclease [Arthrobacter sp. A2-55]|uniref:RecB family exonuclease n=1 Tax=Arthrobacter sp. A2-55 TaxID=2897337 RepID=UPI0021CDC843|nr:PD-(D/E)XK nuclease family protein [Arthrobacter sp. A2-55]MCU6479111.1 PD-(D/E)XK nuclease family protein [Arthrobacter sp. A2-55]
MGTSRNFLGDRLAWDGTKLAVTDTAIIDAKLRREALSASTSKSMQSCAARWVGERLLRSDEEDPFAPAPLGTAAHSVMEDFYDDEVYAPSRRTMRLGEKLTIRDANIMWPTPDTATSRGRWITEVKAAYEGIFEIEDPTKIKVWARELQIDGLTINGVPTNGYIDRVRVGVGKNGRRGLIVEDYKTGRVPIVRFQDDQHDQVRLYNAAIQAMTGEAPVGGALLYTKFGQAKPVDLRPAAMNKTLSTFADSWDRHNRYMESGEFPTKVSALCSWCPLVNSCPVAAAASKTVADKIKDQVHSAVELGIPVLRPGLTPISAPAAHQDSSEFVPDEEAPAAAKTPAAAHMEGSDAAPEHHQTKEETMSITEDKPWETYTAEGELNPSSYAAIGAAGLSALALSQLEKAGISPTARRAKALAATFRHITVTAQESWTGHTALADGANTRMRGFLHTILETMTPPFNGDKAAWDAWVDAAIKRCKALTSVTLYVFNDAADDAEPWADLVAGDATTAPAPTAVPEPAEEPAPEPAKVRTTRRAKPVAEPAATAPDDLDFPDDDAYDFADAA